jgi:RNA polymerase sigma factor (sigma-70 family)
VTEEDLVKGLQTADEVAFRRLVDTYQKQVFNTCQSLVHNPTDADDLTQEVFIEIYRSVKNFRGSAKLSTWIYRIAVNKIAEPPSQAEAEKMAPVPGGSFQRSK